MKAWCHIFRKHGWLWFHISIIVGIILCCFLGPYFCPYDYHTQDLLLGAQPPSWIHWCGTDVLGRDLLARLLYGGSVSLCIGGCASLIAIVIGVIIGSIAGYCGGSVDRCLMRGIDILYPLPFTLLIILVMALSGRHLWLLILTMGCVKWFTMARMVRSQVMRIKTSAFVQCAQSMGVSPWGIWRLHIFPNLMSILLVYGTLLIPNIILEEAFISFLGLGVQPPLSSLGMLILEGAKDMEISPWLLFFPCCGFSLLLFSLNFLGDELRDRLNSHPCL